MTPMVLARLKSLQGLGTREMHVLHRESKFSDKDTIQ